MQTLAKVARGKKKVILINGGAGGADTIARLYAEKRRWEIHTYEIGKGEWVMFGRMAGGKRNQRMIDEEHIQTDPIDVAVAFPMPSSAGTYDCMKRIARAGIRLIVVDYITGLTAR